MAAAEVKYKMVRSKSFDASLTRLPTIQNDGLLLQSKRSSRARHRNELTERATSRVVIISRAPVTANNNATKARRGSLKQNDLIKSMFEQLASYPKIPEKLGFGKSASSNSLRHRHLSEQNEQQFNRTGNYASARFSGKHRQRSLSAVCLTKARSDSESTELSQRPSEGVNKDGGVDRVRVDICTDPAVRDSVNKCQRWVDELPLKFSGMHNAVPYPVLSTEPD